MTPTGIYIHELFKFDIKNTNYFTNTVIIYTAQGKMFYTFTTNYNKTQKVNKIK